MIFFYEKIKCFDHMSQSLPTLVVPKAQMLRGTKGTDVAWYQRHMWCMVPKAHVVHGTKGTDVAWH
jgi:hypothetical protein